jgi:hypothetical protein
VLRSPNSGINAQRRQWKKLRGRYLFNEFALTKVFRARFLEALKQANLPFSGDTPAK